VLRRAERYRQLESSPWCIEIIKYTGEDRRVLDRNSFAVKHFSGTAQKRPRERGAEEVTAVPTKVLA